MARYEVWSAGDACWASTVCHGTGEGESFQEACAELFDRKNTKRSPFAPPDTNYDPKRNTYWGCRLFDNAHAAYAEENSFRR